MAIKENDLRLRSHHTPYKGYLITRLLNGDIAISKDDNGNRYHISFAKDFEDAKRTIDSLAS